jgi:mRNA interferase MazF
MPSSPKRTDVWLRKAWLATRINSARRMRLAPLRGEIWVAELDPIRGSEQAGVRPVLVVQTEAINRFSSTVVAIPLTSNLRRAALPSCTRIVKGEGGLAVDSIALCHQIRAMDKTRLREKLGSISSETLLAVERCMLFTLGIA